MIRVPGPTPGPLPAAAPASLAAVLVQVPENLRALAIGALLGGTVQGRDADGTTWLKTGSGLVGLRTNVPLPAGVTVTLQLQSVGAQLQATILPTPPPQAPPTGAQGAGAPAPTMAPPPNPAAPTSPPPAAPAVERPTAPSTVTATIIGPPGGRQMAPPAPSPAAPLPPQAAPAQPASPQTASPSPAPVVTQGAPPPAAPPAPAASPSPSVPSPPPAAPGPGTPPGPAPSLPGAASAAAYQKQMLSVPATPSPAPAPTAPAAAPAPATPAPIPAHAPASGAAPPAAPPANPAPAPLPTGTQMQLRLVPDTPPPTAPIPQATAVPGTPAQAGAPSPAQTLAARVVGQTPSGQTILDAPVGRLLVKLPEPDSFRPGQIVQIQLAAAAAEQSLPADIAPKPLAGALALARAWPALGEAVRLLRNAADPALRAAPERILPQPGPGFARRILAFLREAASGGAQEWLGETVRRAVETLSGGGLAARIESDLHELLAARRAGEQNWQMTVVPFLDGADLRQIRFFERRRKDKPDPRRGDDPARFVVECEHGEYGALQLDGLMQDKRLDLVLRSHAPLPDTLERDVLVIFGEACGALGLNGQLFFQAMAEFPVHPLDEFGDGGVRVSV